MPPVLLSVFKERLVDLSFLTLTGQRRCCAIFAPDCPSSRFNNTACSPLSPQARCSGVNW